MCTLGQTALTDSTAATKTVTKQSRDGSWSFIIPRFFAGGTVVGGTKQPGNWTVEPEVATREKLLSEGGKIAGMAMGSGGTRSDVKVIADIVGRRPMREGGMRIEIERPRAAGWGERRSEVPVVHAYGAGGRGFEISWGVAEEVADLVKSVLGKDSVFRAKL